MSAREPKCRICGCTQFNACPGGCGWFHESPAVRKRLGGPICTICSAMRDDLQDYIEYANRVSLASLARLLREVQS